ncbi:pro-neuregulin-4, membrane-bound isoform [Clupea harengus]|uniref:Pro-neuregulin-4, membrane-bound isoform n=1 Tax=Clupea harengus TaxID=7950 RepID=A0A6P8EP26_CLUHA|nr:pro-neuregulin-4, membrane-bound isoform [Clupea harengus]
MADHGNPCDPSEAPFCMNGGSCFKIPSVSTPTCMCIDNYEGSRCEQSHIFQESMGLDSKESGMIAAVVIIILLITVLLAVVIYYTCKSV